MTAMAPRPPWADIRPLTDREFGLFRTLIYREAGIHLSEAKRALLLRRLTPRLRELGLSSFSSYYRRVRHGEPDELVHLLDRIVTNETSFFREPRQFEFLAERIVPGWIQEAGTGRRSRHVRAWSAACATGEEAYSLAMVLLEKLPRTAGWTVEILATDLSTRALETAAAGVWPASKGDAVPLEYRRRFLLRGVRSQEGKLKAVPELRRTLTFKRLNLALPDDSVSGPFDLVLCRNVLIYFDRPARQGCLRRIAERLAPGGYLFLGHSEALNGSAPSLRAVAPSILRARAPWSMGEDLGGKEA